MSLRVVMGPPTGGKSTWVMERAGPQDIVVDWDRMAVALAGPSADSHDHGYSLREITMAAWRAAVDEAVKHADAVDVYLIHSIPPSVAITQYRRYGAYWITVDPGRQVVRDRCRRLRPDMLPVAERWYRERARIEKATAVMSAGRSY